MSRKHFSAIAETLRTTIENSDIRLTVAREMSRTLVSFNSNFDKARFIEACMKE